MKYERVGESVILVCKLGLKGANRLRGWVSGRNLPVQTFVVYPPGLCALSKILAARRSHSIAYVKMIQDSDPGTAQDKQDNLADQVHAI